MTEIDTLIAKISTRRIERLLRDARVSRQTCPRASALTDCPREMYHQIVDWDKKPVPKPELLARFKKGIAEEAEVFRELSEDGFQIEGLQRPFEIKNGNEVVLCTGHVDGIIQSNGTEAVLEVKSLNPLIWRSIETIEDFNRYWWARRYPRQMQMYLLGLQKSHGLYVLTDCLGHRKYLPVEYDAEEAPRLLRRCANVMDAVRAKSPPWYPKDRSFCRHCWCLGSLCTPDMNFGPEMQLISDVEIEAMLEREDELAQAAKEHAQLVKRRKERFRELPNCLVGHYHITGEWRERKLYTVEAGRSWQMKIERV